MSAMRGEVVMTTMLHTTDRCYQRPI
jgi:hypothetical protein